MLHFYNLFVTICSWDRSFFHSVLGKMAGDGGTAVGSDPARGGGRGRGHGRGRGGSRGHGRHGGYLAYRELKAKNEDIEMSGLLDDDSKGDQVESASPSNKDPNKLHNVPYFGLPSLIIDGIQGKSQEQVLEDLKSKAGFQDSVKVVQLAKGGFRVFSKSVGILNSPEFLGGIWPGASVAGRWGFIPGTFEGIPESATSGYLRVYLSESNCHQCKGGIRVRFNSDADLAHVLEFGVFIGSTKFKVLPNIAGRAARTSVEKGCMTCERIKKKCMRCTAEQRERLISKLSRKQEIDPTMELVAVIKNSGGFPANRFQGFYARISASEQRYWRKMQNISCQNSVGG